MSRLHIREPEHIREDAAAKLRKLPVGDELLAVLGCLLDEVWTTPRLREILISPEGKILVRLEGEEFFAALFRKSVDDLI